MLLVKRLEILLQSSAISVRSVLIVHVLWCSKHSKLAMHARSGPAQKQGNSFGSADHVVLFKQVVWTSSIRSFLIFLSEAHSSFVFFFVFWFHLVNLLTLAIYPFTKRIYHCIVSI